MVGRLAETLALFASDGAAAAKKNAKYAMECRDVMPTRYVDGAPRGQRNVAEPSGYVIKVF